MVVTEWRNARNKILGVSYALVGICFINNTPILGINSDLTKTFKKKIVFISNILSVIAMTV